MKISSIYRFCVLFFLSCTTSGFSFAQQPLDRSVFESYLEHSHEFPDSLLTISSALRDEDAPLSARVQGWILGGECYRSMGIPERSLDFFLKALRIAESAGDKRMLALAEKYVGLIHAEMLSYDTAITWYKRAQNIYSEQHDTDGVLSCLFLEGIAYGEATPRDYQMAFLLQRQRMRICAGRKDSIGLALGYNELSGLYAIRKQTDSALYYLFMAYRILRKGGPREALANTCNKLAGTLISLGKMQQAYLYIRELDSINTRIGDKRLLIGSCAASVWYYETIGKYDEALKYAKRQNELQRSFYKLQVPREVAEMKEKYETEKKEREIQALRQAALIRNVVILAATLLLLVIVLLFNRRQLKLKSSYQRKINEQQEALFKTAVHVQDQERKRFAEDLHDGPGSVLSAVKLNLGRLRSQSPDLDESQKEKLGEAQDLLDEAIRELRNIAHNMMPPSLSRFGLKDALENLLAGIEKNSGISISFNYFSEEERLPENVEISVYRIMLEVMNNIVKHSRASEAVVQLVQHREYLSLTAEDNGTGFEKNERNVNGMGLSNIRSRVEYLGGRLEIDSFPGKGTTISIEIPLEKKS